MQSASQLGSPRNKNNQKTRKQVTAASKQASKSPEKSRPATAQVAKASENLTPDTVGSPNEPADGEISLQLK